MHEELKKLYEIDCKYCDTPWQWWQIKTVSGEWTPLLTMPIWSGEFQYRRKQDAPVWPDDAEDARKWRELMRQIEDSRNSINNSSYCYVEPEKPKLIQGYTADQWQTIIDGGFICEFGDLAWRYETWGMLEAFHEQSPNFMDKKEDTYSYCRPLRIKGVRQPWFGRENLTNSTEICVRYKNGDISFGAYILYQNYNEFQIQEFIEL